MPVENPRFKRIAKKAGIITTAAISSVAISGYAAMDLYPQVGATIMDTFGSVAGDEYRLKVEGIAFAAKDVIKRGTTLTEISVKSAIGKPAKAEPTKTVYAPTAERRDESIGNNPSQIVEQIHIVPPFNPPEIKQLNGKAWIWSTEGLPNPKEKVVMTGTEIYPYADISRSKSLATVICIDHRYTKLHMVGGLKSPGSERKVIGPGKIPEEDIPSLLLAFNGGWQGEHAPWGMYANGKEYKPLKNGYASIVIFNDGSVKIGTWGRDFTEKTEDMIAIRQNSLLLIDNGELTADLKDSVAFGLVNAGDTVNFFTSRSAIGITMNGDLLIASGNDMNQVGIANALWAAGAQRAMILDNNLPYVQTVFAHHQPDGSVKYENSRKFMSADPKRFISKHDFDFMYITQN